jgi:glutamine synthetase
MNLLNAEAFFEDGGFEYIRFEQTDLNGLSRSKTVPVRHFRRYAENGLTFFGGLLSLNANGEVTPPPGTGNGPSIEDQVIWPDPRTLSAVPWIPRTARVLSEPSHLDGTPVQAGPRLVMRQVVQRLSDLGYSIRSSFDYQFYLVDAVDHEPVGSRPSPFLSQQNEFDPAFMIDLLDHLSAAGVDITMSASSFGPGQMTISYASAVGINASDQAFTFRNGVKEMAALHGYVASFMTRPYANANASGSHLAQSLIDRRGTNLFADDTTPEGLSPLARYWIGGQLHHAAALTAICAPTVNCMKRYGADAFAPRNVSWGYEDSTAAVCVRGARRADVRIENRLPGAATNPYLAAAAVIAAGMDGIANALEPPPPSAGGAAFDANATSLPTSLGEAVDALANDSALVAALGNEFVALFVAAKRTEIATARRVLPEYGSADWPSTVTEWEQEMYFDVL